MKEAIKQKLKAHPTLLHAEEVKAICSPLQALNVHYFGKARVTKEGKLSALGSDAHYFEHYFAQQYYNYDLHMDRGDLGRIVLWDAPEYYGKSLEMYQAEQHYKLHNGVSIINKTKNYTDYYHFASHIKNTSILNHLLADIDLLNLFANQFDEKVSTHHSLKKGMEITFDLDYEKGGHETNTPPRAATLKLFAESVSSKQFKIYHQDRTIVLSKRELEMLHWLSLGKTSEELALICGIAKSTVDKHIDNIKKKSHCYTLFQLGELFAEIKKHPFYGLTE